MEPQPVTRAQATTRKRIERGLRMAPAVAFDGAGADLLRPGILSSRNLRDACTGRLAQRPVGLWRGYADFLAAGRVFGAAVLTAAAGARRTNALPLRTW